LELPGQFVLTDEELALLIEAPSEQLPLSAAKLLSWQWTWLDQGCYKLLEVEDPLFKFFMVDGWNIFC